MSDLPSAPAPDAPVPPDETPAVGDASASEPTRLGLLGRLSDRLNPILVREVQQALNGRGFVITAGLALLAVVILALVAATREREVAYAGSETFIGALQVLAPILFFILPFQAFLSMRAEVGGGTVEHLLMSRLGPGAIMRGKLLAATVQFVIYLAIFSPLLALTFLLRGVDVPTIAVVLMFAFFLGLACSAVGIACGALCRWRAIFRVIPWAIAIGGLGWFTIAAAGFMGEMVWVIRETVAFQDFWYYLSTVMLPPLGITLLCALVGAAVLSHPYENRSTSFRLFAFAFILVAFASVVVTRVRAAALRSSVVSGLFHSLGDRLAEAMSVCALMLCLFPLFATTEAGRLTPRMRVSVSRRAWLALLLTPLLPGGGRGMLFSMLLGAVAMGGVVLLPTLLGAPAAGSDELGLMLVAWLYVVLYAGIAGFFRSLLGPLQTRNWVARGALPVLLLLSVLLPLLASLVAGRDVLRKWSVLHLLNPFRTVPSYARDVHADKILATLLGVTVFVVILNLPSMIRSVREVLEASRARRQRAR